MQSLVENSFQVETGEEGKREELFSLNNARAKRFAQADEWTRACKDCTVSCLRYFRIRDLLYDRATTAMIGSCDPVQIVAQFSIKRGAS